MWRLVFATAVGDNFVSEHECDINTMTRFIGKAGVLDASIPVTNAEIGEQIQGILSGAGKLTVYAYNGGKIFWGGFLDGTAVTATENGTVLDVTGTTFEIYPDRREMRVDGKFTGVEQTEYVRKLWDYMQSTFGGDIGIETDFPALVTRRRDMKWLRSEAKTVGELLADVAGNIDGFEWGIDCFDDGGRRRRVLRVGHPQLKRPSLPLILSFPGNMVTYSIEADAAQGATSFQARGMSEDRAKEMADQPEEWGKWTPPKNTLPTWIDQHTWQEWAALLDAEDKKSQPLMSGEYFAADLLNAGYVRTDMTVERGDVWTVENLNAWAKKAVEMRGGPLIVPQVLTFLHSFDQSMLGSYAKLQITDTPFPAKAGGAPGYEGAARCIGYEVIPSQFGAPDTVKLVFEDPFSRSMQTQARQQKTLAESLADAGKGGSGTQPTNGYGGSAGKIGIIANPWGGPQAARVILDGNTDPEPGTFNYSDHLSLKAGDKVLLGSYGGHTFITNRVNEGYEGDWVATVLCTTPSVLPDGLGVYNLTVQGKDGHVYGVDPKRAHSYSNHFGQQTIYREDESGEVRWYNFADPDPAMQAEGFHDVGQMLDRDPDGAHLHSFTVHSAQLDDGRVDDLKVSVLAMSRDNMRDLLRPSVFPRPQSDRNPDWNPLEHGGQDWNYNWGGYYVTSVEIITGNQDKYADGFPAAHPENGKSFMFTAAGYLYFPVEVIVGWSRDSAFFPTGNGEMQQALFFLKSKIMDDGTFGPLQVVEDLALRDSAFSGFHAASGGNSITFTKLYTEGFSYIYGGDILYFHGKAHPISCTWSEETGELIGDMVHLPRPYLDEEDVVSPYVIEGLFLGNSFRSYGQSLFCMDRGEQVIYELEVDAFLEPRTEGARWRPALSLQELPWPGEWEMLVGSHRGRVVIYNSGDFNSSNQAGRGHYMLGSTGADKIQFFEFDGPSWDPQYNPPPYLPGYGPYETGLGFFSYGDRMYGPSRQAFYNTPPTFASRKVYRVSDPT